MPVRVGLLLRMASMSKLMTATPSLVIHDVS
jgi:hypothetical protein